MSMDWDDYDDRDDFEVCPKCMGDGEVPCHCGGDLCICENYGDAPCPTCHGEGVVTHERAERYMAAQREFAEAMREAFERQQFEDEQRRLENEEMERHHREHPHG